MSELSIAMVCPWMVRCGRDAEGKFKKIAMPTKEELSMLYLNQNLTPHRIGQIFKVSSNTVRRWLQEYSVPLRRPYTSYVKDVGLSETEKAYLAGYLDGDGTITANFFKSVKSKRKLGITKDVALITKNKAYILDLQRMVGGKIQTFVYEDSREKKEGYRLSFCNQASALAFLNAIVPYLILKKRQAELMIKFLSCRLEERALKGNAVPISDESWRLLEEIRRLNNE